MRNVSSAAWVAGVQGLVPGAVHALSAVGHHDAGGDPQVLRDGGLEAAREVGGDGGVAAVHRGAGLTPDALAAPRHGGGDGDAVVHRGLRGERDGQEGLDVGVGTCQRCFRGGADTLAAQQPRLDDLGSGVLGSPNGSLPSPSGGGVSAHAAAGLRTRLEVVTTAVVAATAARTRHAAPIGGVQNGPSG